MTESDLLVISPEGPHERLDKLLKNHYPTYSRAYFQFLIEQGAVLVNGEVVKKRMQPSAGDEIEICFLLTPEIKLEPQAIALDILFEDEHILAINKPVGMVVHPAPGHPRGTFVNALLHHCREHFDSVRSHDLRPGIVHRLDKDTSGVLIAAKTPEAHRRLIEQFSQRSLKKIYLAICVGSSKNQTIDAPIGRHPQRRKEMAIVPEGRAAITHCKVLERANGLSLVELQLVTGRTHQIRVHMQHCRTPILGDPVYGFDGANQQWKVSTQMLHALQLELIHPIFGTPLLLRAPPPANFSKIGELFLSINQLVSNHLDNIRGNS